MKINSPTTRRLFPKWLRYVLDVLLILVIIRYTMAVVPEPENPYIVKYPNANAVIMFDSTWIDLEADGRYLMTKHYVVTMISDKGVKQFSQANFGYFLDYDTVYVLRANVITPYGSIIPVPDDAIKDIPLPAFKKFFMENIREKIITFPGLEVGSSIDVVVCEEMRSPPIENHFDLTETFQYRIPVIDKYFEIRAPKEMNLRWAALDGTLKDREAIDNQRHVYSWSARHIDQIIPEDGMPPASEIQTRLLVSTIPDWQFFSKWYYDLSLPSMQADQTVKDAVAQVISGIKDRDEQMKALYYFVAQNIRYVETALTGKKAGYKPEPASVTLRNRYGVCRDKAALLVAMLREINLPAEIVLINGWAKVDGELPVDQFNHAIVAVAQPGGKWLYMDPTLEKATEYLPSFEQDKPALICTQKGEDLQPTPTEPPDRNTFHVNAQSKLDADGKYTSQVSLSSSGVFDYIFRSWLGRVPPARREMIFQQLVQSISTHARLQSFDVTDLTDLYTPVTINLTLDIPNYSLEAGKYLMFKMPLQGNEFDILSDYLLRGTDIRDRKYPIKLMATFQVLFEESVDLPIGWETKSIPEEMLINGASFSFVTKTNAAGSKVTLEKKMTFASVDLPLDEIPEIQKMLKDRSQIDRGRIFLRKQ